MTKVTKYMRGRFIDPSELDAGVEQIQLRLGMLGIALLDTQEQLETDTEQKGLMRGDLYDIIVTFEAKLVEAEEHANV